MHPLTTRRRQLFHDVRYELTLLGSTADEVAARLQAVGVRGFPTNIYECAIARYLSAVLGADLRITTVEVSSSEVAVDRRPWWRLPLVVSLPPAVRQFVGEFDAGIHPDLVDEDSLRAKEHFDEHRIEQ